MAEKLRLKSVQFVRELSIFGQTLTSISTMRQDMTITPIAGGFVQVRMAGQNGVVEISPNGIATRHWVPEETDAG